MSSADTIYALSSGHGMAGVAVVRVSGSHAGEIVKKLCGMVPSARTAKLCLLRDPVSSTAIDQALVLWFPGPRSFTGENLAEFHVHGSQAVLRALFGIFGELRLARPAEPGEFTRRAFVNGRIDLAEAEGLADLLRARTDAQRLQALRQALGQVSSVVEGWRSDIVYLIASVEAVVDFADEADVGSGALAGFRDRILALVQGISNAVLSSSRSELVRDGVRVILAGSPNTGKSSLLNLIASRDVAIVSPIPGTTRDSIEVMIELEGLPVIVTDTAGLRMRTADEIERLGMERTQAELSRADILVWVTSPDIEDDTSLSQYRRPDIVVSNKSDLYDSHKVPAARGSKSSPAVIMSAKTGDGFSVFLETLAAATMSKVGCAGDRLLVGIRQLDASRETIRYLNDSLMHRDSDFELVAEDLRQAANALGRITGRVEVDEWLEEIFSRFCIGK